MQTSPTAGGPEPVTKVEEPTDAQNPNEAEVQTVCVPAPVSSAPDSVGDGEHATEQESQRPKRFRSANWSTEEETLLITIFQTVERQHETRKAVWEAISLILKDKGYDRKPASLEQKWGNMLQTYRAIKEFDRTRIPDAPTFFESPATKRRQLFYQWKVNSLEAIAFGMLDGMLLKDRTESGTAPPHTPGTGPYDPAHASSSLQLACIGIPPARNHTTFRPDHVFGSMAQTLLGKVVDLERVIAKTSSADLEKSRASLFLLNEYIKAFEHIQPLLVPATE